MSFSIHFSSKIFILFIYNIITIRKKSHSFYRHSNYCI